MWVIDVTDVWSDDLPLEDVTPSEAHEAAVRGRRSHTTTRVL